MKIELRRVAYSERLSEETANFAADIWIDGVKAGDAKNNGHGGQTMIHPRECEQRLAAHAATLPPEDFEGMALQPTADSLVDAALDGWLAARDLKKAMGKRVLFTVAGKPGIFETKSIVAGGALARMLSDPRTLRERLGADKILNLLPFDEALALYRSKP